MSYRVIDAHGVEWELAGDDVLVERVRSGALDEHCLFWDERLQRWRSLVCLEACWRAREPAAEVPPGRALADDGRLVPPLHPHASKERDEMSRLVPAPSRSLEDAGAQGVAERPDLGADLRRAPRRGTWVVAFGVALFLVAAAGVLWTAAVTDAAPRFDSLGPELGKALGLGLVVTGLLLVFVVAEECYWLALTFFGHRGSNFTLRFIVQACSLSFATLVLLGMAGLADPLTTLAVRLREWFGLRLDPGFPARVVGFLAAGDLKAAANVALVQHVGFIGGVHALGCFGAARLFIRSLGAPRNAFVSMAVAAMIFGTAYMALKPTTRATNTGGNQGTSVQLSRL